MKRKILDISFWAVCWMLFYVPAGAQDRWLVNVQFFSVEQGVSDRTVFCVNEDDRGIIWVGTGNGLNRFDGKEFVPVRLESQGFPSGDVVGIKKDEEGLFWIQKMRGVRSYIRFDPIRQAVLPSLQHPPSAKGPLELLTPAGFGNDFFFKDDERQLFYLDSNRQIVPFGNIQLKGREDAWPTSWGNVLLRQPLSKQVKEIDVNGKLIATYPLSYG
ncbi:MAG: two-component regulator propeller domain-containing protein, partial [Bacteroidota bacterium]